MAVFLALALALATVAVAGAAMWVCKRYASRIKNWLVRVRARLTWRHRLASPSPHDPDRPEREPWLTPMDRELLIAEWNLRLAMRPAPDRVRRDDPC